VPRLRGIAATATHCGKPEQSEPNSCGLSRQRDRARQLRHRQEQHRRRRIELARGRLLSMIAGVDPRDPVVLLNDSLRLALDALGQEGNGAY
jgi:hypothetical protein